MNIKLFFGILLISLFFTSLVSAGDVLEISTPSDLLELREPIGDVRTTITDVEMPNTFLQGGIIYTNQGSTEYNQYLRFWDSSNIINSPVVNYTENQGINNGFVEDYLYIRDSDSPTNSSTAFFEYELEFESGLKSIITSSTLPEIENKNLKILGEDYVIFDTSIDVSLNEIELTLLSSEIREYMDEGQITTYSINGEPYVVTVLIIEDVGIPTVTFKINGIITSQIREHQTIVLNDGTIFAVGDILISTGYPDQVEIFLGVNKLVLKDTEYTDTIFVQNVKIDNEYITNALVQIVASEQSSATELEIYSIRYRLSADALNGEDVWVAAGHGVREYLDEPQGMLGSNWDIRYEGLDDVQTSIIKLDPSGDDEYNLIFENMQGLVYNVPYITNEGGTFKFGTNNRDLVFEEGVYNASAWNATDQTPTIGHLDYFVLSSVNGSNGYDNEAISHVMRYGNYDAQNNELKFEDMATGETRLVTYSSATAVNGTLGSGSLTVGGTTYKVYVANATSGIPPLMIDQDADGTTAGSNEVRLTANGGAIIDLGNHGLSTGGSWTPTAQATSNLSGAWVNTGDTITGIIGENFNVTTLQEDFDEDGPESLGAAGDEWTSITVVNRTSNEIGLNKTTSDWAFNSTGGIGTLIEDEENNDYYSGMTDFGALWTLYDAASTDNPETLTIEYPLSQRGARVFIAEDFNDFINDITPPSLFILSPIPTTYGSLDVLVDILAWDENELDSVWYEYNGTNYTYVNSTMFNFVNGANYLKAYANDTSGNIAWGEVYFEVDALPDLLISTVEQFPANPIVGDIIKIDLTLTNAGTDINSSFNWVYDFNYGTNINSFALNSGDSLNLSFSYNYSEGGEHIFYFEVDPTNVIVESNETNNILLYDIFIDGNTDLNPVLISKKKDPNNRNNILLTYRINNFGNIYAENYDYNVNFGDGTGTGGIISNRINPNGYYDFNLTHEYFNLGVYDISFEVDSMNFFTEFNETNNIVNTEAYVSCDKKVPGSMARCAPKKK